MAANLATLSDAAFVEQARRWFPLGLNGEEVLNAALTRLERLRADVETYRGALETLAKRLCDADPRIRDYWGAIVDHLLQDADAAVTARRKG